MPSRHPARPLLRRAAAAVLLIAAACGDGPTGNRPNPTPRVTAVAPAGVLSRGPAFTLTVRGVDFVQGSVVRWDGVDRPTTYVSATELSASIAAADIEEPGTVQISVFNPAPGGGVSSGYGMLIGVGTNPVPVVTGITPASLVAGTGGEITIRGTGFTHTSLVGLGTGTAATPTYVSSTELRLTIPPAAVPAGGEVQVVVINGEPGGGVSAAATLLVTNPAPVASAVTPSLTDAGQDSLVVRVTGTGFVASSVIHVSGGPRPTRLVSATEVAATLSADDLSGAGTFNLTVVNPAPGGGTSAILPLTLRAPFPVLAMLPASGAAAGRGGFPLRVHGTGFVRGSVVRWNGEERPTRYLGYQRLEITVSDADVAAPGTATIDVHTPGAGTSSPAHLQIRPVPAAVRTSMHTLEVSAVDMVYDPHSRRLYASLGPEGTRNSRILAIDPETGTVVDSVMLFDEPASLAVSEDGSALWVELNGTREIRRVALPSLTPGASFSLGEDNAAEIHPMPGRPGTVAVLLERPGASPGYRGIAIYDDGVRRALVGPDFFGSNTIAWGEDPTVLYGADAASSDHRFYTYRVDAAGVREVRMTPLLSYTDMRIRFASGRVYGSNGAVIDADRHERVGAFEGQSSQAGFIFRADPELGRAFYVHEGRFTAYDMNTFQSLGSFAVSDGGTEHPSVSRLRLVRWAADGLAYRLQSRIVFFRTPLAAP
ncbi:IPT/TIG domain-containing protein [Longimicrobium sp.]|uniref:IPT/TIG domain-containing protein n=1 Tax=Longimicrobium sp. TaxID=2029185 RepID=UPI003B3AA6FC